MSGENVQRFLKQTAFNYVYLLIAFPLGVAYFVILVTGLSVGLALSVILWGIPVLLLVGIVWWYLAAFERWQAIHLLNADVRPMRSDSLDGLSANRKILAHLTNPVTWTSLLYLLLKFPFGIAAFIVIVTTTSMFGAFVSAPFTYQFWDIEISDGDNLPTIVVDTLPEALIMFLVGLLIILPLSVLLVSGMAYAWRRFAMLMLGDHRKSNHGSESLDAKEEPIELAGRAITDSAIRELTPESHS